MPTLPRFKTLLNIFLILLDIYLAIPYIIALLSDDQYERLFIARDRVVDAVRNWRQ